MRKARRLSINPARKKTLTVKVNADGPGAFSRAEGLAGAHVPMTEDTEALVQRWILAFCERPIIIDPALMRMVLDGPDATKGENEA